jgi:membrane-associated protease RseP (regulator of RpoE activity)
MSTTDQPNSPDMEPTQPPLDLRERERQQRGPGAEPAPIRSPGLDLASPDDGPLARVPAHGRLATGQRAADSLELSAESVRPEQRRRVRLPVILFVATCLSTFWVGANHWLPIPFGPSVRQMLIAHWADGLIYMACVLGILLTHEMGHFLATLRYRIPASLPFFIPFPISPIGTMGAVIGMDGLRANRREMFDIGLAGPLAGLLVAVPIMCIGILRLDLTQMAYGPFAVDLPLFVRIALQVIQPPGYEPGKLIWFSQLNPYFMAGWVGFLITGLNMLPVSQLDGGHVIYTLFGKRAHWVARAFVLLAVGFVVVSQQWNWMLMIVLVLFIGTDHPPTKNDRVPLGRVRIVIGCLSILIPIFCFAPWLLIFPV